MRAPKIRTPRVLYQFLLDRGPLGKWCADVFKPVWRPHLEQLLQSCLLQQFGIADVERKGKTLPDIH